MTTRAPLHHHLRRITGRDPAEPHRTATTLELLFDLTFVIAFGASSTQLAHAVVEGHAGSGLLAFAFATFAVSWGWINYTWWASAFDTDDWFVRLMTLVQMVGVIIIALGIPDVFRSMEHGELDNQIVVLGYVIMRLGLLPLWIRVAVQDPGHRRSAALFATTLVIAQCGWVAIALLQLPLGVALAATVPLYLVELTGPVVAERVGSGTPWHPHHVAERYGLVVIITLGEVVLGTASTISAVVQESRWTLDAGLVAFGGIALAFALWWVYFTIPSGEVLARHRERGFVWGYGHIVVFGCLVAVGAGLDVAALSIEGDGHLGRTEVAAAVAVPVFVLLLVFFTQYSLLMAAFDAFHILLFATALALLVLAVVAASAGAPLWAWLALVVAAPAAVIVGYETVGHRHQAAQLERMGA
ncbi:MAG: low temperature requirement protein A [Protaetiibacter sp.]